MKLSLTNISLLNLLFMMCRRQQNFNIPVIRLFINMESGTLLHIALLRKTSNAKKRQKSHIKHPKQSISGLVEQKDENFTISGWNCDEQELRMQAGITEIRNRNLEKLRKSFQEQARNVVDNERSKVKTSDYHQQRPRLRSQSDHKYAHHKSTLETKHKYIDENDKLKQLNSEAYLKPKSKLGKLNICYPQQRSHCKENSQIRQHLIRTNAISSRQKWSNTNQQNSPHSFTNFLILNNVKARNFFKL